MPATRTTGTRTTGVLTIVVAALALLGLGCSSDDDTATSKRSDERETTTTERDDSGDGSDRALAIGQQVVSSDDLETVDSDMQICVGDAFIDAFDDDAERVADTADGDSDALTAEERTVLIDAVDGCIPSSAFAEFFLSTVYGEAGMGAPDPTEVACLGDATDGQVGQIVDALDRTDEPPANLLQSLDDCIAPATVAGFVEAGLRQADELPLTDAQISCIAQAAAPNTSFAELIAGNSSGLEAAITAALPACPA